MTLREVCYWRPLLQQWLLPDSTALGRILFSSVIMVLAFRLAVLGSNPVQTLYFDHAVIHLFLCYGLRSKESIMKYTRQDTRYISCNGVVVFDLFSLRADWILRACIILFVSSKNFDPCHPARTAQADIDRYFLHMY